jgi:hypothetical protein
MSDQTEVVVHGGCQCGKVRFAASLSSYDAYYCHCRMCQRAFGNIFATYVGVRKANIAWEGSGPAYYESSKIARRGFCARCGTPLTFEYHAHDKMDLALGALDHPEVFTPKMHCGVESRVASFHTQDGLPEKRIAEFEHIVKKWKDAYGEDVVPGIEAAKKAR